jgi:LDH2 family malate/lactate/ureidoglycolate dehydrogenase
MIVQGEPLRRFADVILQGMGAPPDVAAEVATHLVRANLSGHDAHGVCRLPEYAALAEAGELRPAARPAIVRETAVAALFDARHGFGQHAAAVALDWCLARAHGAGVAVAAVRRSGDVGRLAEYAERAAEAGVLAIVTAGSAGPDAGETMLHGGRTRFLGANSWAFAAPGRRRWLAFEGSTSTVAAGEVLLARAKGEPLPPDCLYDRFGRPSTDPADLAAGGGLVPLGGAVAGHKGMGLAFASALFGGLAGGDEEAAGIGGVFLEVVDPAAFGDTDAYQARVERTLVAAKSVRPVAGRSEVLLPGEPEARSRTDRGRTGVRLPETTWADLGALAARFGVEVPA